MLRPLGHREHAVAGRTCGAGCARVLPPARTYRRRSSRELDTLVGQAGGRAAARALAELAPTAATSSRRHGQTVFHWVTGERTRGTLQIGQPAWIVEATGLPAVSDLRARDVAAGGHGRAARRRRSTSCGCRARAGPRAALNLGGIANVTIVGDGRGRRGFDTGPGNCLLDDGRRAGDRRRARPRP